MQVLVSIYRGEDYSNYHDALKDGAVYDYISPKSFSDLSVSDFQVDKAMSVADMLGQPSIVAVIIGNGHIYGEIEFGNINFDSLEALKPDAFKSMTKYSVIGWNYETGMGAKTIVAFPSNTPMEDVYNEVNGNFRKIAEERCGNADRLWVAGITKIVGDNPETYACDESPEYDEYGFEAKKKFRYSLTTHSIWFGGDNGEVVARNYSEARELAMEKIETHINKINSRISDIDVIEVELNSIEIEEA